MTLILICPSLLTSSASTAVSAVTGMTFIDFQTPYTPTTTDIYYAAYTNTANLSILYAPSNLYANHNYGVTTGTLNLRSQYCSLTSLPATILSSQAMTSQVYVAYVVLYGP